MTFSLHTENHFLSRWRETVKNPVVFLDKFLFWTESNKGFVAGGIFIFEPHFW